MVVYTQIKGNNLIGKNNNYHSKSLKTTTTIQNHPQQNKKRIRKRKETSG